MRWTEVCMNVSSGEIDQLCENLSDIGIGGFVIENEEDFREFLENNRQYWDYVDADLEKQYAGVSRIKFYLEDNEAGKELLRKARELHETSSVSVIQDSDWENNWREFYHPIEVGQRLIVVPEWEHTESDRLQLRLDPGLIFGTGSHPTTKMCLAALEDYAAEGKKVLDLGCGSGILGIGALVLGCESSLGCDIDAKAPDVACANAAINDFHSDRFRVVAGDIISDKALRASFGTGYDIVCANIVSDVIIALAPHVKGFMNEASVFITSGIIDGRENEVAAALEHNSLHIIARYHDEEWNCFVAVPV